MSEKAVVTRVTGLTYISGTYSIYVEGFVTDASMVSGGDPNPPFRTVTAMATSTNFNPLLPNWRARIRDAVIAAALSDWGLTVDAVMFGDFGVLGL